MSPVYSGNAIHHTAKSVPWNNLLVARRCANSRVVYLHIKTHDKFTYKLKLVNYIGMMIICKT